MRQRTAEDWAGNGVPWLKERHLKNKYTNDSRINKSRTQKDLGFFHNLRKELQITWSKFRGLRIFFDMNQHAKEGVKQTELDLLSTQDADRRLGLVNRMDMELVGNTDRLNKQV